MKSRWTYNDATNVVGYYNSPVTRAENSISKELKGFDHDLFSGHKVVIDPATALTPCGRRPTCARRYGFSATTTWTIARTSCVTAKRSCASSRSSGR